MSIPRSLTLKKIAPNREEPERYILVQKPVRELQALRADSKTLKTNGVGWPPKVIAESGQLNDLTFELDVKLTPGKARSVGLRIRTGDEEFTEIGYDRNFAGVYVDRSKSGDVGFHAAFPGRHKAPARIIDGHVRLQMFVDRSTIEVFINDGEAVISDRIFPTGQSVQIEAFAGDETAGLSDVRLHQLQSIWSK